MIIDSHCHLDFPGLAEDEAGVVARAHAAGIGLMVTIATSQARWNDVIALAGRHAGVVCALGVHPHEAGKEGLTGPEPLIVATADPLVVGIGESGLDYHYDFAPRDAQGRSFEAHIEAAQAIGLPLIVHTREADEDTMAMLEGAMRARPFTGVIHCYSSSRRLAERAVAIGLYLGIGGILTFRNSQALREAVRDMPLERLLLETDAPYLAPMPHRGKRNEPAYTALTARVLAEVKGVPVAEIERATTENFHRLFTRAAPVWAAA